MPAIIKVVSSWSSFFLDSPPPPHKIIQKIGSLRDLNHTKWSNRHMRLSIGGQSWFSVEVRRQCSGTRNFCFRTHSLNFNHVGWKVLYAHLICKELAWILLQWQNLRLQALPKVFTFNFERTQISRLAYTSLKVFLQTEGIIWASGNAIARSALKSKCIVTKAKIVLWRNLVFGMPWVLK